MGRWILLGLLLALPLRSWGQTVVLSRPPVQTYFFSCNDTVTTPQYLFAAAAFVSSVCAASEAVTLNAVYYLSYTQTISNLRCIHGAVDADQTWGFTVRKNGVNTALACTSLSPATDCVNLNNSVEFSTGDTLSLEHTDTSAQDGAQMRCSIDGR